MAAVNNPILPGFHPDPTICRAGSRYYLATSTFAYFPGVPVYESTDLVRWRQIGNVLTRDSQLPLANCGHSKGIFAPTLRFHNGTFYMVTTNISGGGNFIVTAQDPGGPWSEPYWLGDDASGIDPSLFFDGDGSCWYVGQRGKAGGKYNGDCEIYLSRLDLETMRLTGPVTILADGFQKNAVWPEGPHIYKKDGYYYLLHAESGTSFHHSVMIARSKDIKGPYEYCKSNPILTHRHLGADFPVTCAGHADLVEDGAGNWYMVVLACRPEERYTLLGRETFLAKVAWEDGWPVVNPGVGRLEETVRLPGAESPSEGDAGRHHYTFDRDALPPEFLTLRNHRERILTLAERPGYLRLRMGADTLKDLGEPAYAAVRVRHKRYDVQCVLEPHLCGGGCAGMALVQNDESQLRIECFAGGVSPAVRVVKTADGEDIMICVKPLSAEKEVALRLAVHGLSAGVFVRENDRWSQLCRNVDLRTLSTEHCGGFVGCTVGMYASGNGADAGGYADFKSFTYVEGEEE